MTSDDQDDDPLAAALRDLKTERSERAHAHSDVRASKAYVDELTRIRRTLSEFLSAMQQCAVAVTRWHEFSEHSFLLRHFDDIGEAAMVAVLAIENGALNPARREMRHILEIIVSSSYVDEMVGAADFNGRVAFFKSGRVNLKNVDQIAELPLRMLSAQKTSFVQATKKAWVRATHYVHPTKKRLDEKIALRAQGVELGFETPEMLAAVANELLNVCSIALVLTFETIGPMFTGDLMVEGFDGDEGWPFHASPYVAAIDAHFDYKHERRDRLDAIRERRTRRLTASSNVSDSDPK